MATRKKVSNRTWTCPECGPGAKHEFKWLQSLKRHLVDHGKVIQDDGALRDMTPEELSVAKSKREAARFNAHRARRAAHPSTAVPEAEASASSSDDLSDLPHQVQSSVVSPRPGAMGPPALPKVMSVRREQKTPLALNRRPAGISSESSSLPSEEELDPGLLSAVLADPLQVLASFDRPGSDTGSISDASKGNPLAFEDAIPSITPRGLAELALSPSFGDAASVAAGLCETLEWSDTPESAESALLAVQCGAEIVAQRHATDFELVMAAGLGPDAREAEFRKLIQSWKEFGKKS
jgi:hypothetical protein